MKIEEDYLVESKIFKKYKKQIDEDVENFPMNPRFLKLEKGWINDVTYRFMNTEKGTVLRNRIRLREMLLDYLNTKYRKYDGKLKKVSRKKENGRVIKI